MKKNFTKGSLPQTSTRAYKKICEEYTLDNAILEIAQNAFEHGNAKVCKINVWTDEKGVPNVSFFNNGIPMSDKIFKKFVSEYHSHDITNSKPSSSGVFTSMKGYGLKDVVVYCSCDSGISKVTFRNYHENGKASEWVWKICKCNGDNGEYQNAIRYYDYDVCTHNRGFEVLIENSKVFTETELSNAQKRIAKTFNSEAILEGRCIEMKWKTKQSSRIKNYDPMHFEQMPLMEGQNIYNCPVGEYISNDIIWFVDEKKFKGDIDGGIVEVPVRVISAYINEPTYKKKYPKNCFYDEISTINAGIFPLLGNSYLETGDNKRKHFGGSDNAGGSPRYRVCPIITNENAFLWGIKSLKNSGVTPFCANYLLCEKFETTDEDGNALTLYDFLDNSYKKMVRFHQKVIRVEKGKYNYYSIHGFSDIERTRNDIKSFKNNLSNKSETPDPIYLSEVNNSNLYNINNKTSIIKKLETEDGMIHSLNLDVLGSKYSESTKEDILFSVFDLLEEMKIDPVLYQEIALQLPEKIRHYEK